MQLSGKIRKGALSPEPQMYNPLTLNKKSIFLKKKNSVPAQTNRTINDTASRFKNRGNHIAVTDQID